MEKRAFISSLLVLLLVAGSAWGYTWELTSLNYGNIGAEVLKVKGHPTDPDVVFAATGGLLDFGGGGSDNPANGFWKSTDRGLTWAKINNGVFEDTISTIDFVVCPSNPDIIYCATNIFGVIKSEDGGATWAFANNGIVHRGNTFPNADWGVMAINVSPTDANKVYASVAHINLTEEQILDSGAGDHPGFFYSSDGGANWQERNSGLPTRYDPFEVWDLTSHVSVGVSIETLVSMPDVVILGMADMEVNTEILWGKTATSKGRVFYSTNNGASWVEGSGGLPTTSQGSSFGDLARISASICYVVSAPFPGINVWTSHLAFKGKAFLDTSWTKSAGKGVFGYSGGWVRRSNGLPVITDDDNDAATNASPVAVSPADRNILLVGINSSDMGNPDLNNSKVWATNNGASSWMGGWDDGMDTSPTVGLTEANPFFPAFNSNSSMAYCSVRWADDPSGGPSVDDGVYRMVTFR